MGLEPRCQRKGEIPTPLLLVGILGGLYLGKASVTGKYQHNWGGVSRVLLSQDAHHPQALPQFCWDAIAQAFCRPPPASQHITTLWRPTYFLDSRLHWGATGSSYIHKPSGRSCNLKPLRAETMSRSSITSHGERVWLQSEADAPEARRLTCGPERPSIVSALCWPYPYVLGSFHQLGVKLLLFVFQQGCWIGLWNQLHSVASSWWWVWLGKPDG